MKDAEGQRDNAQKAFEDEDNELQKAKAQWEERLVEREKREKLDKIIKEKEEEMAKRQKTLDKAAQFLQAHWRGLMARRDQDKARKGKKGRKGRKR